MHICNMGYEVKEDLIPPERCHCDDHPDSCEDCYNYNKEYEFSRTCDLVC